MNSLANCIKEEYNEIAHNWRHKVWVTDNNFKKKIVSFAKLKSRATILDVGIGTGDFASLFKVKSVTGIDISKRMIKLCKRLHSKFKLVLGNAERLPFRDNSFDAVCCRNYLQNFEDPSVAFSEMTRVLKKRGTLLVVESAVFEKERIFPTLFCRTKEPFHPLFPSHEQLRELFEESGIKNIKQEVVGIRRKWLRAWQKSKKTTLKQTKEGYNICLNYPEWYKEKYQMELYPRELEIKSILTFSFIKGIK